jgi:acetyl esterase/lipase
MHPMKQYLRTLRGTVAAALLLALIPGLASAQTADQTAPEHKNIVYATVDGKSLALDLYMPASVDSPPLVVWVHGGAWRRGSKDDVQMEYVEAGFAMASVEFRQSTEARFPAQVHDVKAAIRFLRAKAKTYGYRTDRIAVGGPSSGGHLAALVGVTNGDKALEGTVGGHLDQSSSVQAILDYFGPTNLQTILTQSTPHGLGVRKPALDLLIGGQPESVPELARLASPVAHVDANDPPLLILHGDQDPQVPINQSHELQGAYEKLGLDVYFDVVHGAAHGGEGFYEPAHRDRAIAFLKRTLGD